MKVFGKLFGRKKKDEPAPPIEGAIESVETSAEQSLECEEHRECGVWRVESGAEQGLECEEPAAEQSAEGGEPVAEQSAEGGEPVAEEVADATEDDAEATEDTADTSEDAEGEKKKTRFGGLRNMWEATRRLALTPVDPWFAKMAEGLDKTRRNLVGQVKALFTSHGAIDEEFWEELEDVLLTADVGVGASERILEELRASVKEKKLSEPSALLEELKAILGRILGAEDGALAAETESQSGESPSEAAPNGASQGQASLSDVSKSDDAGAISQGAAPCRGLRVEKGKLTVVLMVGVNGAGKTTTTAKLAAHYKAQGFKVLMAAADTFRAAAIDQLQVWAERIGVDLIRHKEGADPAAVVFDAVSAAKARGTELLLVDTAGRLHNKANLMEELRKIKRVAGRDLEGAPHEIMLVLDATTGQNALEQARVFNSVTELTGLILCKLDGTSRGGIIVAIAQEFNIPVRYIGVGEGIDDLREFSPRQFLDALFAE